jgi:hypothetical protein
LFDVVFQVLLGDADNQDRLGVVCDLQAGDPAAEIEPDQQGDGFAARGSPSNSPTLSACGKYCRASSLAGAACTIWQAIRTSSRKNITCMPRIRAQSTVSVLLVNFLLVSEVADLACECGKQLDRALHPAFLAATLLFVQAL